MNRVEKTRGILCRKDYGSYFGSWGMNALQWSLNAGMGDLAQALVKSDGVYDNAWVDELDE
jgi:hypothetical protein